MPSPALPFPTRYPTALEHPAQTRNVPEASPIYSFTKHSSLERHKQLALTFLQEGVDGRGVLGQQRRARDAEQHLSLLQLLGGHQPVPCYGPLPAQPHLRPQGAVRGAPRSPASTWGMPGPARGASPWGSAPPRPARTTPGTRTGGRHCSSPGRRSPPPPADGNKGRRGRSHGTDHGSPQRRRVPGSPRTLSLLGADAMTLPTRGPAPRGAGRAFRVGGEAPPHGPGQRRPRRDRKGRGSSGGNALGSCRLGGTHGTPL